MVFTSENISTTPAIQVRWVAPSSSEGDKTMQKSVTEIDPQKNMSSLSTTIIVGGFTMKWHLTNGPASISNEVVMWEKRNYTASNKKDLNLMTILNLVHKSKVQRVDESNLWKTLLKHRWDADLLKTNPCLNEGQILKVVYKTGQDLNLINGSNLWNWIPEENLDLGKKLYLILRHCPGTLIEKAKLSALFDSLLINENLNTVVAATMHNIQPRAGDNIKDLTAINMWYQRLDERYNFSLGSVIHPLLDSESLLELKMLKPPFMKKINNTTKANRSAVSGKIQ